RERNVDEDFAKIIRIPGSCEEPILDQAFSFPQYVELLRITHVVKKDSGDVQDQRDGENVRRQSLTASSPISATVTLVVIVIVSVVHCCSTQSRRMIFRFEAGISYSVLPLACSACCFSFRLV